MKLLVKSDQYAFRLYRPGGELPETLPEHRVEGHRCIGHYSTLHALIKGAREHVWKDKSKKAVELREFLSKSLLTEEMILKIILAASEKALAEKGQS